MKVEVDLSRDSRASLQRNLYLRIMYLSRRIPEPLDGRPEDARDWAMSQVKDLSGGILGAIGQPDNKVEIKINDVDVGADIDGHRVRVCFDLILEGCPVRGRGDWYPFPEHSACSSDGVYHVRAIEFGALSGMPTRGSSLEVRGLDQSYGPYLYGRGSVSASGPGSASGLEPELEPELGPELVSDSESEPKPEAGAEDRGQVPVMGGFNDFSPSVSPLVRRMSYSPWYGWLPERSLQRE